MSEHRRADPGKGVRLTIDDGKTYLRNLTALRSFQPDVAAIVDGIPVPCGAALAVGRDGSETIAITGPNGRVAWLGQSSMPTISAPELLIGFQSDGRNVALPGMLTGREPLIVLERLHRHCALFVLEDDPLQIKLALHLYDYAEFIDSGRLILVPGPDLTKTLVPFFERHFGCLLPANLLPMPQRSSAQIADLRRRLESAGEATAALQHRITNDLISRIATKKRVPMCGSRVVLSDRPRTVVVGADATPPALQWAGRMERAFNELGWTGTVCVPDRPGRCHVAARLQAIDSLAPELVLVVNGGPNVLAPFASESVPVVPWLLPETSANKALGANAVGIKLVLVSTRAQREELIAGGVSAEAVISCPPACGDEIVERGRQGIEDATAQGIGRAAPAPMNANADAGAEVNAERGIAIVMNLPDARAEICNITLPSHVALWQALTGIVCDDVDAAADADDVGRWLTLAERHSGTALEEASVRDHFLSLIRSRLVPFARAESTAQTLRTAGSPLLWGTNWELTLAEDHHCRGGIPWGRAGGEVFSSAAALVLPDCGSTYVQWVLDGLGAGVPVICRASRESFERMYLGLDALTDYVRFYRTSRELARHVKDCRSSDESVRSSVHAAQDLVRREHTVAHRLKEVATIVRERSTPNATVTSR